MRRLSQTEKWATRLASYVWVEVPLAAVPEQLGLPEDEAAAALAELLAEGLVELWPEKRRVCLSALAVERLDLEMVLDRRDRAQWHDRGGSAARRLKRLTGRAEDDIATIDVPPEERPKRRPAVFLECDLRDDDGVSPFDDYPGPSLAELAETTFPVQIMGVGMAWPVRHEPGEKCKGCRHCRKMPTIGYCGLCHRSGDARLPGSRGPDRFEPQPDPRPKPKPRPVCAPRPDGLAGGVGKAAKRGRENPKIPQIVGIQAAKSPMGVAV